MPDNTKSKKMILGNDDDFENPADRARYNALHPYVPDASTTEDDDFKTPADRAKYNAQNPYVPNGNSTSSRILGNGMKSGFNASYKKPDPVTDIFNKVYGPVNPLSQANPIATMSSPEYSNKVMKSMFDDTNFPVRPQPLPMIRILPPKDNTSAARALAEEAMQNAYRQQADINADLVKSKDVSNIMEANKGYDYLRNLDSQINSLYSQAQPEQNNLNNLNFTPPTHKKNGPDWFPDNPFEILGRPTEAVINASRYAAAAAVSDASKPQLTPELFNKETYTPTFEEQLLNALKGKTLSTHDIYTVKKTPFEAAISGLKGEEAPTPLDAMAGEQLSKKFEKEHPLIAGGINAIYNVGLDPLTYVIPGAEGLGKVGLNALRSESLATKAMEAAAQETRLSEEASRLATEMMKNPKMTTFDALAKASPELQQRMTTELLSGSKTALDELTEQTKNILGDSFANKKLTAKDLLNAASQKQWNPVINKLELAKYLPKAKPFMPNWGSNVGKTAFKAAAKPAVYNDILDAIRNLANKAPNDGVQKAIPELQQMTTELLGGGKTALGELTEQTKNILGDSFAIRKLTAKDLLNAASQRQWSPVINALEDSKYIPKVEPAIPNWLPNAGKGSLQAAARPAVYDDILNAIRNMANKAPKDEVQKASQLIDGAPRTSQTGQPFNNVLKLRNTAKDGGGSNLFNAVTSKVGNAHLKDLPIHPDPDKFYIKAAELLNESRIFRRHPTNLLQREGGIEVGHGGVKNLTNEELIKYGGPNGNDPISGQRIFMPDDISSYPASGIKIESGHHRLEEIPLRIIQGEFDPNILIEMLKRFE